MEIGKVWWPRVEIDEYGQKLLTEDSICSEASHEPRFWRTGKVGSSEPIER